MDQSFYKYLTWAFVIIAAWALFSGGCSKDDRYDVNVQTSVAAADGLDLKTVGTLLKEAKDAEHFERLVNDPNKGIDNLDLDENGEVDYIKVTEYGSEEGKGFSLTVDTGEGQEQEIATIGIEKAGEGEADVQIHGNRHIYGENHYHHSRFSLTDYLLLGYIFRPHPFYFSPWRRGYYPSYYRPYRTVSTSVYRTRTSSLARSSGLNRSSSNRLQSRVRSPNAGKTASNIKAPLKQPTASQKSFQARNPSKTLRSGGFGRSSRSSRTSRPSVRRSGSSRSYSSFGGK